MSDLFLRTVSAVVMMVVALAAAFLGGYWFAILVAAAATAIFYEWQRLTRGRGFGWSVAGFLYALLPALAILWVRDRADNGLSLLLWVFAVTWATDIGGYLVGRTMGRTRLAPAISPAKTVEGLAGGVAAATLLGAGWVSFAGLPSSLFLLAPVFALAAQGGDLFESALKRQAGAKDSGGWLPGHGGILDRLDGLIPVAILTAAAQLAGLA